MHLKNIAPALILFSLIGCATSSTSAPSSSGTAQGVSKPLNVAPILRFEDVPVPAGFKMLHNESFSFENKQYRLGILKYVGRSDADDVSKFYKDQMPLYNWNLLNIMEYGRKTLNYEKADETCIITVEFSMTKTLITISVAPKTTGTGKGK